MSQGGSAAANTIWINPTYTTTTTLGSYYPPAPSTPPDEIEWLRGRVEEITALCA
jgi:hypothetical protein